jgi:hypothetical protein
MRTAPLLALILLAPLSLDAQSPAAQATRSPNVHLGASFLVAEPQQDFRDHINTSYGGSINARWAPTANGPLALRFEAGGIGYGSESKRVPLSPTVGRVTVDVTTSNFILFAHAGPQLTLTRGALRPYIAPSLGVTYIATVSSVSGDDSDSFAEDTNFDDVLFSYGATGGVLVPLATGRVPVALDFSVRYYRNGEASFLVKGAIHENGDGTITLNPVHSSINLLTFQIGASIGIPHSAKETR